MVQHGQGGACILFELAGATYAVPSEAIQQLEMIGDVTPVPNAPPFVEGVTSIRGQVIPVISLRARFGFPPIPHDLRSRLLVVRSGGRTVGLVVDSAREFTALPADATQPPPETITGLSGRYLTGIAHLHDRLVLVLDVAGLLDPDSVDTPTAASAAVGA